MASAKTTESVNYYLKHGKGYANHNIYLQFKFDGHRFRYYLQQAVDPKRWNAKKQRVKDADTKTADGRYRINDLLNTIAQITIDAYYTEAANGIPTPAQLKKHLDAFINQHHDAETIEAARPTFMQLVDRFVMGEMKIMGGDHRGKDKAPNTLKSYQTTKGHLEGYQTKYKTILDFENITLDWYMKFTTYMKNQGLTPNSIGKQVKNVKAFMAMANKLTFEMEGKKYPYTTNKEYLEFGVHNKQGDDPYLSEAEIMAFYNFDLSTNKRLEAVRDLFVFGCMVGLRYSDYSNVKPENIIEVEGEKFIFIKTKKTGAVIHIPCNPVVLDIFNRYHKNPNKLPRTISGQKFNEYIKQAAQLAGMNETGRKPSQPNLPLYECITSHTARRSFATNYYLDGFPTIDLMKITGHSTEKSFLGYIRVTQLQAAKRMAEHNKKKNWAILMGGIQERQLRVAS
jgi:integrase